MNIFKLYKLSKSNDINDQQKAMAELEKEKTGTKIPVKKISQITEFCLTIIIISVLIFNIITKSDFNVPIIYAIIFAIFFISISYFEIFGRKKLGKRIVKKVVKEQEPTITVNATKNEDIERINSLLK